MNGYGCKNVDGGRTKQNDSFAFELDGSTPRSFSFRLSLLVIVEFHQK